MPNNENSILTGENNGESMHGIMHNIDYEKEQKRKELLSKEPTIESTQAYKAQIFDRQLINRSLTDPVFVPLTARVQYPHIALGSFSRAFRDYIHYSVYNKFNCMVFGSYNKAIQSYYQRLRTSEVGTIDIGLPIFSYTFQIDGLDDKVDSPWRSTTFLPGISRGIYESFYIDNDFELKVVYRRLKGTINTSIFCSSEAELLDIQMAFFDGFRGLNVYNQTEIRAMTVLPNQLLFTDYQGRKIGYALDGNKITKAYIPSINQTQYFIYTNISAIINMNSINQSSNYYGSATLPEYNLTAAFNFEIEIPQYILCLARRDYKAIEINLDVAYKYEDRRVLDSISYVTGKHMPHDINRDRSENSYIYFEKGKIIDSAAFNIDKDSLSTIDIKSVFPGDREWHYLNKDIILLIIYAGGIIRCPMDKEIAECNDDGVITIKQDLFNQDDFIEIYVFRQHDID